MKARKVSLNREQGTSRCVCVCVCVSARGLSEEVFSLSLWCRFKKLCFCFSSPWCAESVLRVCLGVLLCASVCFCVLGCVWVCLGVLGVCFGMLTKKR